jgi:hypothetical protein
MTGEVEKSQVKPVCAILDGNRAMSRKLRNIPDDNEPKSRPDTLMVGSFMVILVWMTAAWLRAASVDPLAAVVAAVVNGGAVAVALASRWQSPYRS